MIKKKLEEYLDYKQPQPYIVSNEQYSNEYKTPVLTAGKSFLLGMTNDTKGIYPASKDEPIILFDDFTTDIKWVDFPFKVKSSACKILVPRNDTNLRFCYYGMKSLNFDASQHKRYWISQYSQMQLPDYPNARKAEIVERLSRIENQINIKENQLNKLDSLVKSRFIEMFGDADFKSVKISEMIDKKKISAKKTYRPTDEIKYIDISSIDNQNHSIANSTNVIFGKAPSRAQQCLKKNDILISTVRPNLKNIAMLSFPSDNYVGSSGFCVLRPLKCNPLFLKYIVLSDDFTNAMIKLTNGANYPAIKNQDVLNYEMIDVPINFQNQFAAFVELVDKSRFVVHSRYFLWLNFTFVSSTIAYSRVVSILECPKRC